MAITYYMVQISPTLLFILLISSGGIIGGLATYLFRKHIRLQVLRSHNEVTGFGFLAIASFYALLLNFVIVIVWGQLNQTRNNASSEGSSAMGLYRDIRFYPDTVESRKLLTAYLDFVFNVIDEEFPNMEKMKHSRKTPEALSTVYYRIEHLKPSNSLQIQLVAEMFNHLNQLDTYRGLRIASMDTEIPAYMWLPIMLGAIITIVFAIMLDIEHTRIHVIINTLLGIFIAMFIFIIVELDHPYTGTMGIKPKAYKQIFTMDALTKSIK